MLVQQGWDGIYASLPDGGHPAPAHAQLIVSVDITIQLQIGDHVAGSLNALSRTCDCWSSLRSFRPSRLDPHGEERQNDQRTGWIESNR